MQEPTVRTSRHLTFSMVSGRVHLYCPMKGEAWDPKCLEDGALADLLLFCSRERLMSEALARLQKANVWAGAADLDALLASGLLVSATNDTAAPWTAAKPDGLLFSEWDDFGWSDAGRYHLHTRLLPRMDYGGDPKGKQDQEMMREAVAMEGQPPPFNHREGPRVPLATLETLRSKCSASRESESELNLDQLQSVIVGTFGATGRRRLPITGLHYTRTSPSGGSRHPTELYAACWRIKGLEPGFYHFDVMGNALTCLGAAPDAETLIEMAAVPWHLPQQTLPAAALVMTSVAERSMFRYREARSYRVLHHDVGHLIETCNLLSDAAGITTYPAYAFDGEAVERLLNIPGLVEPVLAAVFAFPRTGYA